MGNTSQQNRSIASMDIEIHNLKANNAILKKQLERSNELLKATSTQVGMVMGEEILAHLAECNGTRFSAIEYNYEKPVGEQ